MLRAADVPPDLLIIELTEHALIDLRLAYPEPRPAAQRRRERLARRLRYGLLVADPAADPAGRPDQTRPLLRGGPRRGQRQAACRGAVGGRAGQGARAGPRRRRGGDGRRTRRPDRYGGASRGRASSTTGPCPGPRRCNSWNPAGCARCPRAGSYSALASSAAPSPSVSIRVTSQRPSPSVSTQPVPAPPSAPRCSARSASPSRSTSTNRSGLPSPSTSTGPSAGVLHAVEAEPPQRARPAGRRHRPGARPVVGEEALGGAVVVEIEHRVIGQPVPVEVGQRVVERPVAVEVQSAHASNSPSPSMSTSGRPLQHRRGAVAGSQAVVHERIRRWAGPSRSTTRAVRRRPRRDSSGPRSSRSSLR